jgi:hypothetical protein
MRRFRDALVPCAAVLFTLGATAAFGQCVEFDKPEELFARSEAVFVGTVVRNEPTGARGTHQIVSVATIRLEKSWKGERRRQVRVGSDRPFDVGKKYVVFASGNPLSTSIMCRWAERIEVATRKMNWLAGRRSRSAGERGRRQRTRE